MSQAVSWIVLCEYPVVKATKSHIFFLKKVRVTYKGFTVLYCIFRTSRLLLFARHLSQYALRLATVFARTTISQAVSWVVLCEFPVVKAKNPMFFFSPLVKSSCHEQAFYCILLYFRTSRLHPQIHVHFFSKRFDGLL